MPDNSEFTGAIGHCACQDCQKEFVLWRSSAQPGKLTKFCLQQCYVYRDTLAEKVNQTTRAPSAHRYVEGKCAACGIPMHVAEGLEYELCSECAARAESLEAESQLRAPPGLGSMDRPQDPLQASDPWHGKTLPQGPTPLDGATAWQHWGSSAQGVV